MLYQKMLDEQSRLKQRIKTIEAKLKAFPAGNFFCTRDGNHYKWFRSNGKKQTYIKKENRQLAEQLASKKYLTILLKELTHEKMAIEFYLRHHDTSPKKSEWMLCEMPEYQKLLSPFFRLKSKELADWMNAPYEHNTKYPEQLRQITASGHLVRSKSEALIDMILYTNKIPFRYECALQLGDVTLYPDFTIRHPHTGKVYYWDHFGLMDDPFYCKKTCSKLELYTSHGIIPSIQLITTYETKDCPLNFQSVEQIVKYYFL